MTGEAEVCYQDVLEQMLNVTHELQALEQKLQRLEEKHRISCECKEKHLAELNTHLAGLLDSLQFNLVKLH